MNDQAKHALASLSNIAQIIKSIIGPANYRHWLCEQCSIENIEPPAKVTPFRQLPRWPGDKPPPRAA